MVTKEERMAMIRAIQSYFETERGEELGDLAAGLLLDFFLETLGPSLYNRGVYDAHLFMSRVADDLLDLQK